MSWSLTLAWAYPYLQGILQSVPLIGKLSRTTLKISQQLWWYPFWTIQLCTQQSPAPQFWIMLNNNKYILKVSTCIEITPKFEHLNLINHSFYYISDINLICNINTNLHYWPILKGCIIWVGSEVSSFVCARNSELWKSRRIFNAKKPLIQLRENGYRRWSCNAS